MRALIQRVSSASVEVDQEIIGKIGPGLLIFLGVGQGDTETEAQWLIDKICDLRIFSDSAGKMNLSLTDIKGEALLVSQFTLYADCRKGRRPAFDQAAPPQLANNLYEYCGELLANKGIKLATGRFAADTKVSLLNDGPVTIMLERSVDS